MNRITKEDTHVLSEAYAKVISEALPGSGREEGKMPGMPAGAQAMPFEAGGGAGKLGTPESETTYETGNTNEFKAFLHYAFQSAGRPGISAGTNVKKLGLIGDFPAKYENWESILKRIITASGKKVLDDIKASEAQKVPDSRDEFHERLAQFIRKIAIHGERPFNISHASHLARNVCDALERAGVVREVDRVNKAGVAVGPRSVAKTTVASTATADDVTFI